LRTLKTAAVILSLLTLTRIFGVRARAGLAQLRSSRQPSDAKVFERSGLAINIRREDSVVHVAPRYL
jgi:hypothetical protein